MAGSEEYDSMRDYLETEKPGTITELDEHFKSAGVAKAKHNREAQQMLQLMRPQDEVDEKLLQRPQQIEARASEVDDADIVVHMGCHVIRTPHIIDATQDLLHDTLGYEVIPLGGFSNCCGILDAAEGDFETADKLDSNRFENTSRFNPDYMVTECTSCHATTEELSIGYRQPDFELISMIEFLHQRQDDLVEMVEATDPVTITLHDHYDGYGWMPKEQAILARELFSALPGVEIVEMDHSMEDALFCNFYTDTSEYEYNNLSKQIWKEADDAGADVIINFWHACDRELAWYEHEFTPETVNYIPFISERLGYDYSNLQKRYKTWGRQGRIDDIIDDARPVFEANGLREEEARELAETVFTMD